MCVFAMAHHWWFLTNSHRIFSSNTDWFNSSLVAMQSNDAVAAPCPTPFLRVSFLWKVTLKGTSREGFCSKNRMTSILETDQSGRDIIPQPTFAKVWSSKWLKSAILTYLTFGKRNIIGSNIPWVGTQELKWWLSQLLAVENAQICH